MTSALKNSLPLCLAISMALPSVAFAQVPPPPTGNAPAPAPAPAPEPEPETAPSPEPQDYSNLSEDEKKEKAKEMYIQAEGLAAEGDMTAATPLYEQAYYLVPGKHGFAYKVGIAAYGSTPRDCNKADEYLRHYIKYGDAAKHPDWMDEAKRILGEIAVSGCKTTTAPAPAPVVEEEPEGPVGGDEPTFTSRAEERAAAADSERRDRDANETPGALKAGVALTAVGVAAIGGGIVTMVLANKNAEKLATLSSSSIDNTSTGFPTGDWDCRVPGQDCAADLEKQLGLYNGLTVGLLVGGGVLAAGGGALIALGVIQKKKAQTAMVTPTFGPNGFGAAASVKF